MKRRPPCVVTLFLIMGMLARTGSCDLAIQEDDCCHDDCQLYLAPSTIPNAGLGVFTAKPLEEGDVIGNGDVAIPIVDQIWHLGRGDSYFWHFDEYLWEGAYLGIHTETDDMDDPDAVSVFCPGVDAAVNCNAALVNTKKSIPTFDTGGLHPSRHAGAGAISPYHNGTTVASSFVPAGGELFKYYEDNWFATRPSMGLLPYQRHYEMAQSIVNKFASLDLSSRNAPESLWNTVLSMPWESRLVNALPRSALDSMQAAQDGIQSLHQPHAIRSMEYLMKNGRCMDNIRPGASTLEGAGRGAFATRFLPKGSIVTGSPLLHIPNYSYLHMYASIEDNEWVPDPSRLVGKQILLNYCWGHAESTLLLCPYGSGVGYMNHDTKQANIKIQFAPNGIINQRDEQFHVKVSDMEWDYRVGLAFDYVATRDIEPGDELFLDYGKEWQDAWDLHVESWEPGSEDYVSAHDFTKQNEDQPLRTVQEQKTDPYPDNINIWCHSQVNDKEVMRRLFETKEKQTEKGLECEILDRVEGNEITYVVRVPGMEGTVDNIPRAALRFADVPYSTDMHMHNAFRHEMMIPDDVFPEAWRNLKKESAS